MSHSEKNAFLMSNAPKQLVTRGSVGPHHTPLGEPTTLLQTDRPDRPKVPTKKILVAVEDPWGQMGHAPKRLTFFSQIIYPVYDRLFW